MAYSGNIDTSTIETGLRTGKEQADLEEQRMRRLMERLKPFKTTPEVVTKWKAPINSKPLSLPEDTTPPRIPDTQPPTSEPKTMPPSGGTGALPFPGMPVNKPQTTPVDKQKSLRVSAVFNKGISADMFDPKSMSTSALDDLCVRYNHALKAADRWSSKSKALGLLNLPSGTTGQYDVSGLEACIQTIWNVPVELAEGEYNQNDPAVFRDGNKACKRLRDILMPGVETLPSADSIRASETNWQSGKNEDSIKEKRTHKITGAKINPDNPKECRMTTEALTSANQQLDQAGSLIRLVPVGDPVDGMVLVRPEFRTDKELQAQHDESHRALKAINEKRQTGENPGKGDGKDGGLYVSWADCHRTAQTIMGSEDKSSGLLDTERMQCTVNGEVREITPIPKGLIKDAIPTASDSIANRNMHAFYQMAMPEFVKELKKIDPTDDEDGTARGDLIKKIEDMLSKERIDPRRGKLPWDFRGVYGEICKNDKLYDSFSKMFEVNEHAKPKVGTALCQVNDEDEKSLSSKDLWNYHWAGVVMVNGDSYMTLENLSVEDPLSVNDNWYFAVYDKKQGQGADKKDFHSTNKHDSHVGTKPLTMVVKKTG
jgi:hypothetical protein